MRKPQIVGLVIGLIGLGIAVFAFNGGRQVAEAKQNINKSSGVLPKNPISGMVNSALQDKMSEYDKKVLMGEVAGVALIVLGAGIFFYYRKKR